VFERLGERDDFGVRDVLAVLDGDPALRALNAVEAAAPTRVR
jgi:hypothetical protein